MVKISQKRNKPGFIMILSLMLIFLCMFLVLALSTRESTFVPAARIAVERKRAYVLAQSGIQMALSQLVCPKVEKKSPSAKAPADEIGQAH